MPALKLKLLPHAEIVYKSSFSPDEIISRLISHVEPTKSWSFNLFGNNSGKAYTGTLNGSTFKIQRLIDYRNSFLPIISGIIEKKEDATFIIVRMHLHKFVFFFLYFWFGGVGLACMLILINSIAKHEFSAPLLIPFGMFAFGYALAMGGFSYESKKAKVDLQRIFEAEIINEL